MVIKYACGLDAAGVMVNQLIINILSEWLMKRRRRFVNGECNHIYQRTVNGFNLFYDREDYLVFYMILSVSVRKFNVSILMLCLMIDHIHILLDAVSCKEMADFVRYFTSIYVREYNDSIGRTGQMMYKSFGSAPKKGDKRTRSAIVYIGNNPVEKKICHEAEDYRWNFIAYMKDGNPFSMKIPVEKCRRRLRNAMAEVRAEAAADRYIGYFRLRRLMAGLADDEKEFLTDHIISQYFPFDVETLESYYSDLDQMSAAMKASAGSDYDIKEKVTPHSDLIYEEMVKIVRAETGLKYVREVIMLPAEEKFRLARMIQSSLPAAEMFQISKFLHIPVKQAGA